MIRVGLIGCGGRGKGELRELATFEDVEVVAVCDPVPEALAQAADEFGIQHRYESIERMLDAGVVDVAFVTTPAHLNAPSALPCLEAGVHTLVEKPPGMRVEETIELRETADRTGAQGDGRLAAAFQSFHRRSAATDRGTGSYRAIGWRVPQESSLVRAGRLPKDRLGEFAPGEPDSHHRLRPGAGRLRCGGGTQCREAPVLEIQRCARGPGLV